MSSSKMSNGIINTVFITNIVTVNIRNYCVCFRLGKKEQEERCRGEVLIDNRKEEEEEGDDEEEEGRGRKKTRKPGKKVK